MRRALTRIARWLIAPLVVRSGPRGFVYLTFDDGPHEECTPAILEVLDAHGVKATFFMVGNSVERHADLAREVVARGHSVGYHSYLHRHADADSWLAALREMKSMRKLERRLRAELSLYRPPYGELTALRLLWCLLHGVKVVLWSVDSFDWRSTSSDEVADRVSPDRVRDGDVILLHDDARLTVAALPRIIENLKSAGFAFGVL